MLARIIWMFILLHAFRFLHADNEVEDGSPTANVDQGVEVTSPESGEERIIGGTPALTFEYPFIVSLQRRPKGENTVKFCGGSILYPQWVLTAAHCFKTLTPESLEILYVKAGDNEAYGESDTSQLIRIQQVFSYDFFDPDTLLDDIALLKLMQPLTINNAVWPLRLPTADYDPEKIGDGVIMGWGVVDPYYQISYGTLKKTFQHVMSPDECRKYWDIKRTQICLYNRKNPSIGCFGDSGGPFVQYINLHPTAVGITSYGFKHCGERPGVYTRVSSYLRWINSTITKNS